jgi:hypothetical protein
MFLQDALCELIAFLLQKSALLVISEKPESAIGLYILTASSTRPKSMDVPEQIQSLGRIEFENPEPLSLNSRSVSGAPNHAR